MQYYIYKITNLINNKIYIGQRRCVKHPSLDIKYFGSGCEIIKAILKYGKNNFKKEIIEICQKDELNKKEIYWISFYNSTDKKIGYNISLGGSVNPHTKEIKKLLSQKAKERWKNPSKKMLDGIERFKNSKKNPHKWTEEEKQIQSEKSKKRFSNKENHPCFGKPKSEKTKEKISNTKKEKFKNGILKPSMLGKKHSEEAKKKMSKIHKGKKIGKNNPMFGKSVADFMSKEDNEKRLNKISQANKGKIRSDESKKRYSENAKKRIWIINTITGKRSHTIDPNDLRLLSNEWKQI